MQKTLCAQLAAQLLVLTCVPCLTRAQASPPAAQAGPAETAIPLAELLAYAAQHAPALRLVRAELAQADAARADAEPALRHNPTLLLGAGPRFAPDADHPSVDVVAAFEQPIEIAGERGSRLRAAQRLDAQLQADGALAERALRSEIAVAYAAASVARERAALSEQLARFAAVVLDFAQRRLAAGDANLIELRVAEADAAIAEQERLHTAQELQAARLLLCETSGWPLATPPLPVLPAPRGAATVPALAPLLQRARKRHPALRAHAAALALAGAKSDLAEREGWPVPVVGVEFERESSPFAPAEYIVLGTLALPLPLFQQNAGARAQARADAGRARAAAAALAQQLPVRIARAHAELSAAAARLALFEAQIGPRLDESLALLERGFTAGEIPLLEVLAARERLLAARRGALDAYQDHARARAELEHALGFELDADGRGATP